MAYAFGPRLGAGVYNLVHIYAFGAAIAVAAIAAGSPFWGCAGLVFMAHVGADRALGLGLKAPGDFRDTHLGRIGR